MTQYLRYDEAYDAFSGYEDTDAIKAKYARQKIEGLKKYYILNDVIDQDNVVEDKDDYLKTCIESLKAELDCAKFRIKQLEGTIDGLKFAIRCNGVSGGEV